MADLQDPNEHLVDPGDGLSTIAHERGIDPKTIWDHPKNSELKKKREHAEILMPGDRVFVPERSPEKLEATPEKENHYALEALPPEVEVHVTLCGKPLP